MQSKVRYAWMVMAVLSLTLSTVAQDRPGPRAGDEAKSGQGHTKAMKKYPVPGRSPQSVGEFYHPTIEKYGRVVKLPHAAQQPRSGSRLLVDLTRGSDPKQLNPAIEKVARYINIYHGAGKKRADVDIAIVLHGDATLAVLNDDAFAKQYGVHANPNLDCLHQLHEEGVVIYVCGQSLANKGHAADAVAVFVDTAVSALTAVVNLQADGYSYVPLLE